jgi:two-component sensor histidine kinase
MFSAPHQRHGDGGLDAVTSAVRWGLSWWRSSWRVGLRPRSLASFIFALLCVAVATLVRLGLGLVSPDSAVFAPYYSATLVAALVGGASAGVSAAAAGGVIALCLFVPPDWSLAPFRLEQAVSVLLFATSSVVIIWAADSYRGLLLRLREQETTRKLLNHELNHRIKNILASVQAIISQTLRDQKGVRDKTISRIAALAATNDILLKSEWSGASLREILVREFTPYDLSRFDLTGDDVECPSEVAILLALVAHELTTNALKYGALSSRGGRVSLVWTKSEQTLYVEWIERGGPKPNEGMGCGFGTKLLRTSVRRFNGSVEMKFEPNGLRVTFSLDLPPDSGATAGGAGSNGYRRAGLS